MKRVAVVIDTWFPFIGGGQINAYEIAKRIAGKEYSVDVITRNCGKSDLKLSKGLKVIKLGPVQNPASTVSKIVFVLRSIIFLFQNNYDIVHAHAFLPGITARIISVFKGTPSVFTVHGTSLNSGLNNKFKELLEKWILTGILYDTQITVSRDYLLFKNINKNISLINNGVSFKSHKQITKKSPGQSLLFVGRLHKQKNVQTLIQALPLVVAKFPNLKLTVVGSGEERKSLKALASQLKLNQNVVFVGDVAQVKLLKFYQSSSLLVLPSIYEGSPLVLLEAWASKLPVVATATGDCPYLIKEGNNGFLINNPLNPSEIAGVVIKALKHKNLSKLGQNGYNFVAKNFSWEKSAKETKNVYQNLLKAEN